MASRSLPGIDFRGLWRLLVLLVCASDLLPARSHASAGGIVGVAAEAKEEGFSRSADGEPSCRCGDLGCMCDLSTAGAKEMESYMKSLGYDTCVDDGVCEGCLGAEAESVYCAPTGQRQKVVCAGCNSPDPPLPFCLPGYKVFWVANETGGSALLVRNESARTGASAGLFHRSCGEGPAPPKYALRGSAGGNRPQIGSGSAAQGAQGAVAEKTTSRSPQSTHRAAAPDESEQLLYYIALNLAILFAAGRSLRRQQQAKQEQTVENLYGHIGERIPSGDGPSGGCDSEASTPDSARKNSKSRSLQALRSEPIGRSISAMAAPLAARAGSALENLSAAANAGSRAKMK